MAVDLSKMTRKQLEKLGKDVNAALTRLKKQEIREARKAAEKAAAKFGVTLADLTGAKPAAPASKPKSKPKASPAAAPAKYANPDDPKQTWTGKGRQPAWYKAAMEAGKDPSSMEI